MQTPEVKECLSIQGIDQPAAQTKRKSAEKHLCWDTAGTFVLNTWLSCKELGSQGATHVVNLALNCKKVNSLQNERAHAGSARFWVKASGHSCQWAASTIEMLSGVMHSTQLALNRVDACSDTHAIASATEGRFRVQKRTIKQLTSFWMLASARACSFFP
jgi:hypothetical protein